MEKLNPMNISDYIPHRPPIILVDKLIEFSENYIISDFEINKNNIFVNKYGIFIEAGLLEHMAQTIALHSGYKNRDDNSPTKIGFIGSISEFNIYDLPKIGDVIQSKATIEQEYADMLMVNTKSYNNKIEIANSKMIVVISNN